MKINPSDISVIVQGAVDKNLTPICLHSIRKILPRAEIVLSTWDGTDVSGLDYDKLVLNKPVAAQRYSSYFDDKINNINRQIVLTLVGLRATTRKYAFKIRTDFLLNSADFLKYFDLYDKTNKKYKVFKHKILSCTNFARNPRHDAYQYLFHPSDIAFFGLRSDLINLFDVPLMTKHEETYYKRNGFTHNRYVPEQYLWVNCLNKNGHKIHFNRFRAPSSKLTDDTEKYFVSNFIFLSWDQFGLVPPKKFTDLANYRLYDYISCITHSQYLELYKKYLDSDIAVPYDNLHHNLKLLYARHRLCVFCARLSVLFLFAFPSMRRKLRTKIADGLFHKFLSKLWTEICREL